MAPDMGPHSFTWSLQAEPAGLCLGLLFPSAPFLAPVYRGPCAASSTHLKFKAGQSWVWWCTPAIPAPGSWGKVFKASLSYIVCSLPVSAVQRKKEGEGGGGRDRQVSREREEQPLSPFPILTTPRWLRETCP